MHGRAEAIQRLQMAGHAVTLVLLETVARTFLRQLAHQPVARDLGDDRSGRDRYDERVAADHGVAIAIGVEPVAAVDGGVHRHFGQPLYRAPPGPPRGAAAAGPTDSPR